ncbi:MAG: DUF4430 domain-containing protein [Patescibacteria group bacterium]
MTWKCVTALLIASLLTPSLSLNADDPITRAIDYLKTKPANPWTTMALIAAGETNVSTDHLKIVDTNSAITIEAPMLAIAASGNDPHTFTGEDLVAKLKNFHKDGQLGDPTLLNDDIFGILALSAAGEDHTDPVIQDSKTTILNAQYHDGSWGDTNTTAAAIQALIEAGVAPAEEPVTTALVWLKSTQNGDGGFPYFWPRNPYTDEPDSSDSSSSAWVAYAIRKAGQDPTSTAWEKNGIDILDAIRGLQQPSGYFAHSSTFTDETSFTPISTAYAVIALADKNLPVAYFTPSPPSQEEETTVSYRIEGSQGLICGGTATLSAQLRTALNIIHAAASVCGFTYEITQTSLGPYLKTINNDTAEGTKGWLYRVNGVLLNVGAADYLLKGRDEVWWHFGIFGEEQSVELSANVLPVPGGDREGPPTISFTVEPATLQFGDVAVGTQTTRELVLRNTGNTGISLTSTVHGDALFTDHLELNEAGWRDFSTGLSSTAQQSVRASLRVPSQIAAGQKTGMLIFWARAH